MSPKPPSRNLTRLCHGMAVLARVLAIGFFVIGVAVWVLPDTFDIVASARSFLPDVPMSWDWRVRLSAAMLAGAHVALLSAALWIAAGLFARFARGRILEFEVGRDLRSIGLFVGAYAVTTPIVCTLIVLALTLGNPPGQRVLSILLNGNELILGVFGALLLVLGHVMREAARMADDHAQIV